MQTDVPNCTWLQVTIKAIRHVSTYSWHFAFALRTVQIPLLSQCTPLWTFGVDVEGSTIWGRLGVLSPGQDNPKQLYSVEENLFSLEEKCLSTWTHPLIWLVHRIWNLWLSYISDSEDGNVCCFLYVTLYNFIFPLRVTLLAMTVDCSNYLQNVGITYSMIKYTEFICHS